MTVGPNKSASLAWALLLIGCGICVKGEHDYVNAPPTWQDYLDVEALVDIRIDESTCPQEAQLVDHWDWDGNSTDCTWFPRRTGRLPLGSRLVRLAFHDAAGHMDGFVDLSDGENAGLESAVVVLDSLHATDVLPSSGRAVSDVLSKADLYSWAGIAAVRLSAARQNTAEQPLHVPDIRVWYGREAYVQVDTNDEGPTEHFPVNGAASTGDEVIGYFQTKFQFDSVQTATLLGAHTLGGAQPGHSGYVGPWTANKNTFNEEFYSQLENPTPIGECTQGNGGATCVNLEETGQCESLAGGRCFGWEQVRVRSAPGPDGLKFQWRHSCDVNGDGCAHLMLNTDVALFKDIDAHICKENDPSGCTRPGEVKSFPPGSPCVFGTSRVLLTCFESHAGLATLIENNANPFNRNAWIDDFAVVFDLMMMRTLAPGIAVTEILPPSPTPQPTPQPTTPQPTISDGCTNNDDWVFIDARGRERRCNWVGGDIDRRCNRMGELPDGTLVRASDACPEDCNPACSM